jgi:hypothetical protein
MTKPAAALALIACTVLSSVAVRAYQTRYNQQYEREMQDPVEDPPDAYRKGEFTFARLRYRPYSGGGGGGYGFGYGRGYGRGRGGWGIDSNRADRLFEKAINRLTRIDSRSVEEIIDVDDGPLLDYPWIYAVEVGRWGISPAQGKRIREYLDRGGFLMVDDFHGAPEWAIFMEGLRQIYPDRQVVDLPNDDPIFHVVSDLSDRFQVPGAQYLRSGRTCERCEDGGAVAAWRGIYDDKGRVVVAICHNMDLGDAWQYADEPTYDEKFASLAIRIAVNYTTYAMTH